MMSETDSELTTDELKELTADAMDTVDCGSSRPVGHRLHVFVKDGEVRVKARNSSLYGRPSVSHPEKEALDEAGLEWEHKTDRRFSDDINPSVVIVTGLSESDGGDSDTEDGEPMTDGGEVHIRIIGRRDRWVNVEYHSEDADTAAELFTHPAATRGCFEQAVDKRKVSDGMEIGFIRVDPESGNATEVHIREDVLSERVHSERAATVLEMANGEEPFNTFGDDPFQWEQPDLNMITPEESESGEDSEPATDGGKRGTAMTDGGEDVTEGEDPDGEGADSTPVYRDGEGGFTDDRMADAWFWAAQADGWMTDGPNAGLEGHYYVTVLAGQAVIVLDGEKFDHESNVNAIVSALHDYDFPDSITSREMETANETRIFIEPDDSRLSSYYVDEWREWEPDSEFSDTEPDHELMTDGGSTPPTDEDLMGLQPGERVAITLASGERVRGAVRDSQNDYPNRMGNGQVKVGLELDSEDADGLFRSTQVVLTAYHADKNTERREDRVAVKSYRYYEEPDISEVVAVERAENTAPEGGSGDATPGDGDGGTAMTDGGEDVTEDSATERYRRALANRSDEYPDDPEDISDAAVFEAARDDVMDSDGELIIRFGADTDGKTNLEVTPGPFRKYYRPNHILMEQCGLSEGVDAALSRLTEALDLRTVPRVRLGTFRVDGDSGRVTAVNLHRHMFEFANSEDHPDTLELEMRHLANGHRDENANPGGEAGGTAMTDGGTDVEPEYVYVRGPAHLADGPADTFAICGVARQGTPTHRIGNDDPLQVFPDLCGNCERVLRSRRERSGGEGANTTPEREPTTDGGEDPVIPHLSVGDDVTLGINTFPATKGGEVDEKISGTVEETSHERALAEAGGYNGTVVIDSEGSTYTVAYNPFDARVARGKTDRPAEVSFGAVVSAETP